MVFLSCVELFGYSHFICLRAVFRDNIEGPVGISPVDFLTILACYNSNNNYYDNNYYNIYYFYYGEDKPSLVVRD